MRAGIIWNQLAWGEFYTGRTCSVSCINFLVRFSSQHTAVQLQNLVCLAAYPLALHWEDGLHTFTECVSAPSRLAKGDKREIVVIFGRIDNGQFFFPIKVLLLRHLLSQPQNRCFIGHCWLCFCFENFETLLKEERGREKNP